MEGYTDADWEGSKTNTGSTSNYCTILGGDSNASIKLIASNEKEKLKELLRERLIECLEERKDESTLYL